MMRALREAVRRSPVAGPIADLATAIQNPALARRLLADARRTRTEMAFARELPPAKADAPLLLILSMTKWNHWTEAREPIGSGLAPARLAHTRTHVLALF